MELSKYEVNEGKFSDFFRMSADKSDSSAIERLSGDNDPVLTESDVKIER